jgi:hypothetical protein
MVSSSVELAALANIADAAWASEHERSQRFGRYTRVRLSGKPHIYREAGEWLVMSRDHGAWWVEPASIRGT